MRRIRVNGLIRDNQESTERYRVLLFVSAAFTALAWVIGIVALGGVILGPFMGRGGILISLYSLIGGTSGCLYALAVSKGILLLIDLVHYARRAAQAAERGSR